MQFSIVAALDEARGIGVSGHLPWRLPGDLKRFRALTTAGGSVGHPPAVIMGHGTWSSLPERFRPLPDRRNIVLSRDPNATFPPGVLRARTFEDALRLASGAPATFIIGGASVFTVALGNPACQRILLTQVHGSFHCDVHFPELPEGFALTERSDVHEEGGIRYHFETYER